MKWHPSALVFVASADLGRLVVAAVAMGWLVGCRCSDSSEPTGLPREPTAAEGSARARAAREREQLARQTIARPLPQPVPEPDGLEPFTGQVPDGVRVVRASELVAATHGAGRGTVLNVWASWCESCTVELPMLAAAAKRYEGRGIRFVFVSVDEPAAANDALRTLLGAGVGDALLVAHPALEHFKPGLSPIWGGALPATFLYDATGRLRYFWGAQVYEPELVPVLEALLAGESIEGLADYHVKGGP